MSEARAIRLAEGLSASLVVPPGAFRLLLAFAVVISHLSAIDVGRLAVLLFFYLSGYWTSRIYQEKFSGRRIWMYYVSRYWRIVPLFLVATIVAAVARGQDLALPNFILLGVASTGHDPTGVAWSLDVELQFYLLLPFILLALTTVPRVTLAAGLAAAALGLWLETRFEVVTVAKFLPVFLLGALTHVAAWRPSFRAALISLAAFVLMTLVTAMTPFISKGTPDPFDHDIWGMIWLLPLLPYVANSLTIRSSKLDRHFGNLSFPLYLAHYPVIALMTASFGDGPLVKLAMVAISCALAAIAYVAIDRPLDGYRLKVTEPRSAR